MYRNLLREFDRLRREMDQIFDGTGNFSRRAGLKPTFLPGTAGVSYPLINLRDMGDHYTLEAVLPGVDPDSLNVNVSQDVVTIAGTKTPPKDIEPEQFHRSERSGGQFSRSISLPDAVDNSGISAHYQDGVLALRIPKAESAKPRTIKVSLEN